jgi:hypothetical protein
LWANVFGLDKAIKGTLGTRGTKGTDLTNNEHYLNLKRNHSVIVFCDYEFFRPVRDDMLVENDVTNCLRPVGMLCW